MIEWVEQNWLDAVQAISIIVGITFAVVNLRVSRRERYIANSIAITQAHRDVWGRVIDCPELRRVMDAEAEVTPQPPTYAEVVFTRFVALHYSALLEMVAARHLSVRPGLQAEVASFFVLPVPAAAWQQVRLSQSPELVAFVEGGSARHVEQPEGSSEDDSPGPGSSPKPL